MNRTEAIMLEQAHDQENSGNRFSFGATRRACPEGDAKQKVAVDNFGPAA
jgi:hypothetical protein